jgi:hypothetical protein
MHHIILYKIKFQEPLASQPAPPLKWIPKIISYILFHIYIWRVYGIILWSILIILYSCISSKFSHLIFFMLDIPALWRAGQWRVGFYSLRL